MNKKVILSSFVLIIGFFLLVAGILWERQTEKSNVLNGDDNINIIAGYMTIFGFLIFFIYAVLLLLKYFTRNK
jgi:hypothetical protein